MSQTKSLTTRQKLRVILVTPVVLVAWPFFLVWATVAALFKVDDKS